jgi:hypothetical protein
MTALIESLYPHASRAEFRTLIAAKQMRCQGHIINLAAKAFIEGVSEDLLESYAIDVDDVDAETLKKWRKSGPVGKLHNIVHWVRHSPQRRDAFTTVCKIQNAEGSSLFDPNLSHLKLVVDNDTRWNSVHAMISRALKLRSQITYFYHEM